MNSNEIIVHMLRQLLKEMEVVSSQGAGYYTCVPFARRFNKLLEQSRLLPGTDNTLLETFESMSEFDPKDPSDKSNVLLGIRVEISQLITYLECLDRSPS
ncbi:MAG TPA: hypothetical protein PLZ53_03780 [Candidatus Hydrogenedentes bacterium]|jgi:hypothetical protein|nr:MAG: hypothetical protein BWY07_00733 [Candidatus Hydrogenedentes bacterium ADurb.Bin170]HNZ48347.1 hypothetical protein [Candidatus Hydrogenedentota bacterium]HOD95541.1 hypothetical protein [Candidatus Hydrogenedentota bacterium]HOH42211.1 hypothetical protein [Candidatus Hydrogenedentota bacterium]HOM48392.1 hypothetical protein [Candidatus Hydrogenedentota bacterium]